MTHRILFVEDNEDTLSMMSVLLKQANIDFAVARTVKEATSFIAREKFDLIVLDNRLPDGDGFDLCRVIREEDSTTPIVFFSAASYPADKARALLLGAQVFLSKPEDIDILEDTISGILSKSSKDEPGKFD